MEYKQSYHHRGNEPQGLSVYSAGSQRCVAGQGWGPGVRDHYLLHYVSAGRGYYLCGGQRYTLSAGEAFVIYPNTLVSYFPDADNPWEYHWVGFVGAEAKRLLHQAGFSAHAPVHAPELPDAAELLRAIYTATGVTPAAEAEMNGRLWLFFSALMRSSPAPATAAEPAYLLQALRRVRADYAGDLSVVQLAREVGVSRSQLYRAFTRHFGQSPQAFLQQYRVREAAALLAATDLAVEEVATSVGFSDALYFSRVFRQTWGESPSAYRRRQQSPAP